MKFDVIDFKYLRKLLFDNKIFVIAILVICLLVGAFFSIKNSFIYVAKTSMIFGRIKPEEQIVSNIVQTNPTEELNVENNNPETDSTIEAVDINSAETPITSNKSLEKNISLTNVNIDSNTLKTCQTLIKSDNLINKLKEQIHIEDSNKKIKKSISIARLQDSNVLLIKVESSSADKACDIANGMAQVFSDEVKTIYNLDNVYIIDSIDYDDVYKTGFNPTFLLLWLFLGIIINCAFIAMKQLNIVNNAIAKMIAIINAKILIIKKFINSKFHKIEIKELPSGEELDENYKVISNISIIDSDFVPSEQPKIDNLISTNIEEFNSKTDLFDNSVSNIPIPDEEDIKKVSDSTNSNDIKKEETPKKSKKKEKEAEISTTTEPVVEKKITKKIGKEEAMSIKAQEELIALREENSQKMREERNKIENQAQIQKRLNDEIEARKKLETELENQRKSLQEERKLMEEQIRKEIQKQLLEEQRILQEEKEQLAYEMEMKEQEEEQRIMEEERLKMLREREERREQQKKERMEKRIIRAEMRKQRAEERAKQRAIANEERAKRQAIRKEEKLKLQTQREAERQEILSKYYEDKNNRKNEIKAQNNFNEDYNYNIPDTNEEINYNNYSTIERVKETPIKRKELSEDFIQDNLYPKIKL